MTSSSSLIARATRSLTDSGIGSGVPPDAAGAVLYAYGPLERNGVVALAARRAHPRGPQARGVLEARHRQPR